MDLDFWKNKKVLITGNTGFKGSWLCLFLQNLNVNIVGYSLPPPTEPSLFKLAALDKSVKTFYEDVRDFEKLKKVLLEEKPEIVIHMAAQPLVRYSYKNPIETYSTNVMGTVNVLEAARYCDSLRAIVVVTSDKCYENKEWIWSYRENEPMGGYDPYSNSKGCAELVVSAYRNSFFNLNDYQKHGVALASARAGNVIGGGDWSEDRLIPDIMKSLLQNEKPIIRNPEAIRPWQHVLEPLCGYLLLAQKLYESKGKFAEAFNFGPVDEDAKPVSWIVDKLCKMWGANIEWVVDGADQAHEAAYLKLDSSKSRSVLGWKSRLNLEITLNWIVAWYKKLAIGEDIRFFSLEQVKIYQEFKYVTEKN
ncbi:MAG: CDP-glucose 4,6-dehydratase [Deltaproteobacteria bacterium]|nr:CDP-glucose 4,6-dehydratase [Deltaproteobacteria bacterium]